MPLSSVTAAQAMAAAPVSYHRIVRRRPSSKSVPATNPNRSRARLVSKARLGWPSGLEGSQRILPPKPVKRAINARSSRIVISWLARAPDEAVDLVAFLQEELSEVGAVLSGDAGDQGREVIGGA